MTTTSRSLFAILIITIASLFVAIPSAGRSPYQGQKSMGLYGGYTTRNESAVAGLYFQYRFAKYFRLAPQADYAFRNKGEDAFTIDLNAHIPVALNAAETVNFYPLAGVGYSVINRRRDDVLLRTTADNRHRTDRFGLNVGGGLEYFASPTLRLAAEARWRWRTDYSSAIISVAIGYRF